MALLDKGADINIGMLNGITALMVASSSGHVEVVKVLLERGADRDAKTKEGTTALMGASLKGHADVMKVLKAHIVKSERHGNYYEKARDSAKAWVEKHLKTHIERRDLDHERTNTMRDQKERYYASTGISR